MKKYLLVFLLIMLNIFGVNKKILIIGSYHKEYQWQMDYINGIKSTLGGKYDYFQFELNTKRLLATEFQDMTNKAFDYYKTIKPDLVVLGDDNALLLMKDRLIGEKIPVVFLGINNNIRNYFKERPKNFTGVLERPLYQRNIPFIKDCLPNTKNVLLLFDGSSTSHLIVEESFEGKFNTKILNVNLSIYNTNSYEEWQKLVLEDSTKYDAIVLGLYSTVRDKNNKIITEDELIAWTSKNVKIPLFGAWSFSVGKGKTIGGLVSSGKDQGMEAGGIIKRILEKGETPISIFPITAPKGSYIISQFELNRWRIKIPNKYKKEVKLIE